MKWNLYVILIDCLNLLSEPILKALCTSKLNNFTDHWSSLVFINVKFEMLVCFLLEGKYNLNVIIQ